MAVELVEIVNPNGNRGYVAAGSHAAEAYGPAAPVKPENAEPAGNATTEEWQTYATDVLGVHPENLLDDQGQPLGRDEIKARYGTPSES